MYNYKLVIQYKGTNYAGWQIQKNAVTVQQIITGSIELILREKINLIGSGRTDSGVHALGQVANFRVNNPVDEYKFLYSLNSVLPYDISVKSIGKTGEDFHARFDAVKRSYLYIISLVKSPFYNEYSYTMSPADNNFIYSANVHSEKIIGKHDFTSFAKKNSDVNNFYCEIFNIHWKKCGDMVYFYIEANRFLHGMVRTLVGTILDAVRLGKPYDYLLSIISEMDRDAAGMAVPAKGLFLYKVKY
jgi:tRNA pseudouridine38-40 synthase